MKQFLLVSAIAICSAGTSIMAQQPVPGAIAPPKAAGADTSKAKKPSLTEKVKTSKKVEGLFTVYQDTITGSVQLYVPKNSLGKEFIYQSFGLSGPTSLYLNQSMHRSTAVFKVVKSFDKLEFHEVNTNFYYDKNNAVSKTAGIDIPDAVFLSEKYVAEDDNGYLVSADGLFLSEKLDPIKPLIAPGTPPQAVFNLGTLSTAKSKYHEVRSYPQNTDIIVDLAYDNPAPFNTGGKDITDARYNRVRMQHSFIEMPDAAFQARLDDPRIGYFTSEINDLTSIDASPFRDPINRWKLVKKNPGAALSEPVEPITWWIENTTPTQYRQTIKEAGEKWNEAFEKAGFKNAVVMKIMPDDASWNPNDIRYNVIRWVSSAYPQYGAIGPSFTNPKTGQIIGSDITIEWFSGSATPINEELFTSPGQGMAPLQFAGNVKLGHLCTLAGELKAQYTTGLTTLEAAGAPDADIKEMHKQFLYYLVLHEMGHTMGLNHNMKASQMLKPSELNNKAITRTKGLIGSVMDYPAINVSLDRTKQGDYYTTKPGPYDLWAIEYGYTPVEPSEEKAFAKRVLSRSTEPDLAFGNDADDMRAPGKAMDPRVNVGDMSSDALAFAEDRFKLVNNLMGKIKEKYSKEDRSYAELRSRYLNLQGQRNAMISGVSRYVGGVMVDRSFVGQTTSTKPFTPVDLATQKRAINLLNKYVFAPNAYDADVELYPYLQMQRRGFGFMSQGEDFKMTSQYTAQSIGALSHILHPSTLQRITNSRLYGNQYAAIDVMNDLVKGIFEADMAGSVNINRQYLQTSFVKGAAALIDEKSPIDEISKAAALYTIKKLKAKLAASTVGNEETKAHRANLVFIINKALDTKG